MLKQFEQCSNCPKGGGGRHFL